MLVEDARTFAETFDQCKVSLIIIDGENIIEYHNQNPRRTLDCLCDVLNDEDVGRDPFAGVGSDPFVKQKNALFRDLISFKCNNEHMQVLVVCFGQGGDVFEYSDPDAMELLALYYQIGGQAANASPVPPEQLPGQQNSIFQMFNQYSESMLVQEQHAATQQRQISDMEKQHQAMERALREKEVELNALKRGMHELEKLNWQLEDRVTELEAENAQLRAAPGTTGSGCAPAEDSD